MTSITLGVSGGGEVGFSSSGVVNLEPPEREEDGLFINSENEEAWMIGWTGGGHRWSEDE